MEAILSRGDELDNLTEKHHLKSPVAIQSPYCASWGPSNSKSQIFADPGMTIYDSHISIGPMLVGEGYLALKNLVVLELMINLYLFSAHFQ